MGFSTRTTSPGLQKTLVATSWADCEPAVITTFCGRASRMPSAAITSQIWVAQFLRALAAAVLQGGQALLGDDLGGRLASRSSGRDCR